MQVSVEQDQLLGKRLRLLQERNGQEICETDENYGHPPPPPLTEPLTLRVKRLSEHAVLPARASAGAAGYDLYRYKLQDMLNF